MRFEIKRTNLGFNEPPAEGAVYDDETNTWSIEINTLDELLAISRTRRKKLWDEERAHCERLRTEIHELEAQMDAIQPRLEYLREQLQAFEGEISLAADVYFLGLIVNEPTAGLPIPSVWIADMNSLYK